MTTSPRSPSAPLEDPTARPAPAQPSSDTRLSPPPLPTYRVFLLGFLEQRGPPWTTSRRRSSSCTSRASPTRVFAPRPWPSVNRPRPTPPPSSASASTASTAPPSSPSSSGASRPSTMPSSSATLLAFSTPCRPPPPPLLSLLSLASDRPFPPSSPPFLRNKLAQALAALIRLEYPALWPSVFLHLLPRLPSIDSLAVDMFAHLLAALDDDLLSQDYTRSPDEAAV